jgi:hypothetical protein
MTNKDPTSVETMPTWKEKSKEFIRAYWVYLEIMFIIICIERITSGNLSVTQATWLFVGLNIVIGLWRIWIYWDLFYNTIQYCTLLIYKMQGKLNTNEHNSKPKGNKKRHTVAKQTKKDV